MSAAGVSLPDRRLEAGPRLVAAALAPLHLLISVPVAVFLAALTAMLFRPPDLKVFPFDRVAFALLVLVFALRFSLRRERLQIFPATWPMLALAFLALLGAIEETHTTEAWSVFAAKWIVPLVLFHFAASIFRSQDSLRNLEIFSLAALAYLALISVLFLFDATSWIYPRFILDESIGIHADRARGPFLQAVANGVCLTILGLIALDSHRRKTIRGIWALLLFAVVPLALLATRTRAVWLAAAVAIFYLAFFSRERAVRKPALALCSLGLLTICGGWLCVASNNSLCDRLLDRSPVDFRLDMYRVGWQMFLEKPIVGWGSEANIQPEVERRISSFHLERYVFHNTYLELGVEHGLIGIGCYAWLMTCLFSLARPRQHISRQPYFLDLPFRRIWPAVLIV